MYKRGFVPHPAGKPPDFLDPAALEGVLPFASTAVNTAKLFDNLMSDGADSVFEPVPTVHDAGARLVDMR